MAHISTTEAWYKTSGSNCVRLSKAPNLSPTEVPFAKRLIDRKTAILKPCKFPGAIPVTGAPQIAVAVGPALWMFWISAPPPRNFCNLASFADPS